MPPVTFAPPVSNAGPVVTPVAKGPVDPNAASQNLFRATAIGTGVTGIANAAIQIGTGATQVEVNKANADAAVANGVMPPPIH